MLWRFSLYGFLKNQQYYEPFLILYLRDRGLSFTMIGVLIGFREVLTNLMEIPSGVVADMWGRRRTMVIGWAAYIASFTLFALTPKSAATLPFLFAAMVFMAWGESFRTGTHKAMIFTWLREHGRLAEKTKVYGYTRSWAKAGSAAAVIVSGAMVFVSGSYHYIWWMCLVPYAINMVNLATYPDEVEGEISTERFSLWTVLREMWISIRDMLRERRLRGLFAESLGFDGLYETTKDYIQPLIKQATLALPILVALNQERRVAVLVAASYLVIYVVALLASRYAHVVERKAGGDTEGGRLIWLGNVIVYASLFGLLAAKQYVAAIVVFMAIHSLHNLWRPLLLSRYDAVTPPERQATVLSVDSQAKSAFAMVMAPAVGFAVDTFGLWPVGVVGLVVSLAGWLWSRREDA